LLNPPSLTAIARGRGPGWRRALWGLLWGLFALSTASMMLGGEDAGRVRQLPWWLQLLLSPLMLLPLWWVLHQFREGIRLWIRRVPLPPILKFIFLGLMVGVPAVSLTVALGLNGDDLDPDPALNTLLYVGPVGGAMLGWYLLRRFYAFSYHYPFWFQGIRGVIEEQGYLVPLALLSGDVFTALLLSAYLLPAWGINIASIFVIMPAEELPQGKRQPRLLGWLLFAIVPQLTSDVFAFASYWGLGAILGRNFVGL